jgi:hypothetical protein
MNQEYEDALKQSWPQHLPTRRTRLRIKSSLVSLDATIKRANRLDLSESVSDAELRKIERVIKFGNFKIKRKGRDLHDWLAQILQVLVTEVGNTRTLEKENAELRKAVMRWTEAFTDITHGYTTLREAEGVTK